MASTTTFASGGYSLALAGGTYDVQFSGAGYDFFMDDYTFGGGANQKPDFIAAQVPEPEQVALMLAGLGAALLRRAVVRRQTAPA